VVIVNTDSKSNLSWCSSWQTLHRIPVWAVPPSAKTLEESGSGAL